MPQYRVREAANLLGVSTDTVHRWVEAGKLSAVTDAQGRKLLEGAELAAFAREQSSAATDPSDVGRSARNRFVGLVIRVQADGVMAQVDIQSGPHSVVSLMSAEAARELSLEPGSLAVAVVKATAVMVEIPTARTPSTAQHLPEPN